jgi:uncharacterized OB-fold protein
MTADTSRPLPTITLDSAEYWASTRAHATKMQRCTRCAAFRFYPTPICGECGSTDFTWELISGRGTVYSFSVVHRSAGPAFETGTPTILVLVTLEEGPTMMADLIDCPPDEVSIGLTVQMDYRDLTDKITLPVFRR